MIEVKGIKAMLQLMRQDDLEYIFPGVAIRWASKPWPAFYYHA